ncbi:MAG: hypothetical protein LBR05_02990 [Azoarcus sp.]|jgi:hypothetical protein|nr:hypothetical protein [Azoarcus sp.]
MSESMFNVYSAVASLDACVGMDDTIKKAHLIIDRAEFASMGYALDGIARAIEVADAQVRSAQSNYEKAKERHEDMLEALGVLAKAVLDRINRENMNGLPDKMEGPSHNFEVDKERLRRGAFNYHTFFGDADGRGPLTITPRDAVSIMGFVSKNDAPTQPGA